MPKQTPVGKIWAFLPFGWNQSLIISALEYKGISWNVIQCILRTEMFFISYLTAGQMCPPWKTGDSPFLKTGFLSPLGRELDIEEGLSQFQLTIIYQAIHFCYIAATNPNICPRHSLLPEATHPNICDDFSHPPCVGGTNSPCQQLVSRGNSKVGFWQHFLREISQSKIFKEILLLSKRKFQVL